MKKIKLLYAVAIILLFTILSIVLSGCSQSRESLLTSNKWIEVEGDYENDDAIYTQWIFNTDGTCIKRYANMNHLRYLGSTGSSYQGQWSINEGELLIELRGEKTRYFFKKDVKEENIERGMLYFGSTDWYISNNYFLLGKTSSEVPDTFHITADKEQEEIDSLIQTE